MKLLVFVHYKMFSNGLPVGDGDTNLVVQLASPSDWMRAIESAKQDIMNAVHHRGGHCDLVVFDFIHTVEWKEES